MKYMGKIVCLMGKSAVGKDSVYKRLCPIPPAQSGTENGKAWNIILPMKLDIRSSEQRVK